MAERLLVEEDCLLEMPDGNGRRAPGTESAVREASAEREIDRAARLLTGDRAGGAIKVLLES